MLSCCLSSVKEVLWKITVYLLEVFTLIIIEFGALKVEVWALSDNRFSIYYIK